MKPSTATIFLGVALAACAPTNAPVPPRAEARAAVLVAKDAWVTAATACIDLAKETMIDNATCAKYLEPAHDAIVVAADAVDAMDPSAKVTPPVVVCSLIRATQAIAKTPTTLPKAVADVLAPILDEAAKVASGLGSCPDGGV